MSSKFKAGIQNITFGCVYFQGTEKIIYVTLSDDP